MCVVASTLSGSRSLKTSFAASPVGKTYQDTFICQKMEPGHSKSQVRPMVDSVQPFRGHVLARVEAEFLLTRRVALRARYEGPSYALHQAHI